MNDVDGQRVVLITGAAGGLGRALVLAFAAAGWRVAAAGHATTPSSTSSRVWPTRMDVTDREAVRRTVASVLDRWGRIDVLVNNAGVTADRSLARLEDAAWDRVLNVNLKGAFLCTQAVLEPMSHRGEGHILAVASFAGRAGAAGQANYAAAKAGLIGLTLSLAREVGALGIRANVVLPGVLPTAMTATLSDDVRQRFVDASVLGRLGDLSENARAIVDLAATRGISGQVFHLDGRIWRGL